MAWICSDCQKKKERCHLDCEMFIQEQRKAKELRDRIYTARRARQEEENFLFSVFRNGVRNRRSS